MCLNTTKFLSYRHEHHKCADWRVAVSPIIKKITLLRISSLAVTSAGRRQKKNAGAVRWWLQQNSQSSWWWAGWLTTVQRQQEPSATSHAGFPASNRAAHLMNMPISSRPDANHVTLRDHTDSLCVPAANQWGTRRPTVCPSFLSFSNSRPLTLRGLFYSKPARQDCIHVNEFMHEHTTRFSHLYFTAAPLCKYFDGLWG